MYKLIDYKEEEFSDGFQGGVDYFYKVRNIKTCEEKWIDKWQYLNMKRQGLVSEDN